MNLSFRVRWIECVYLFFVVSLILASFFIESASPRELSKSFKINGLIVRVNKNYIKRFKVNNFKDLETGRRYPKTNFWNPIEDDVTPKRYRKRMFSSPNSNTLHDQTSSLLANWVQPDKISKANNSTKETKIAEIFMGVAYGIPLTTYPKESKLQHNDSRGTENKNKKYISLDDHKQDVRGSQFEIYIPESKTKNKNPFSIMQPKRVQKSLTTFREKPKSLVMEIPTYKINFSLPQLYISTEEQGSEYYNNPISTKTSFPDYERENNKTTISLHVKDDIQRKGNFSSFLTVNNEHIAEQVINCSNSTTNFVNENESPNWTLIRLHYAHVWFYHDHFVLFLFSFLSLFPLIILFQLHFMKKNHITPKYCSLLMVQLLILCLSRIVLYTVDPFGITQRFPLYVVSLFHTTVQSLLIYSTGLFLVILVFPVYRPKSQILPRILASCFLVLFFTKVGVYLVFLFTGEDILLKKVKLFISAVNFAEIGSLTIGYVFLNLCTRQRHKIWWIRIYKKSLHSANNSFSVLYSKLKRSIRLGSAAALIQLINTFLIISADFDLKLIYLPLFSTPWFTWMEESLKRSLEGLVCLLLILGTCLLFVPIERTIIKKRSSLRVFADAVKGRRRSQSQSSNAGYIKQPLNIFTLNKNGKSTDYATTDFQLVWSKNRTLPLASISGNDRRKSAKSLDLAETGMDNFEMAKDMKFSQSVDILNGVYESKSQNSFALYDNLQHENNRTPIYHNQYFHYDYSKYNLNEQNANSQNISEKDIGKRRIKKKPRPKSYVEEKQKINENYLTSYFSVISMDKCVDKNLKSCTTPIEIQHQSASRYASDEINSPMISNEKWKDIKITSKSCTIKLNSKICKKNLCSSKSVDFF